MKKVGIITIYRNNRNYGGLLQAYALQKSIADLGYDSEILDYVQNTGAYKLNRLFNLGVKRALGYAMRQIKTKSVYRKKPVLKNNIEIRTKRLHDFEKSIPHSTPVDDQTIAQAAVHYDILVCGSDQIWNPGLWSPVMFLDIPGYHGSRFSYAASIGRSALTSKEKGFIKKHAAALETILVRERSAENLLAALVKQPVQTVLDPTFLLCLDDWKAFAVKPPNIPNRYVFSFFLGENYQAKSKIHQLLSKQIPVVTIPHLQTGYREEDERFSDMQLYDIGPREWVWLILNADIVMTDSFHGTAFSINLKKRFFCFPKGERTDQQTINSRLVDLVSICGLDTRFIADLPELDERIVEVIDFDAVAGRLNPVREESKRLLTNALEK